MASRMKLRRVSRGNAWLAALALVVAHLAVLLVVVLTWLLGLAEIFRDVHWIPAVLATIVFVVAMAVVFKELIGWARDYEKVFSAGAVFVLSWLHWFLLIGTAAAGIVMVALVWADMRWHHLFATPEMEGLRDRAVTMPIPADWTLDEAEERNNGFPADFYEYQQYYDVPASYEFAQLADWLASPEWETTFGALRDIECDAELERCRAEVVPEPGQDVVYFVEASYRLSDTEGTTPTVNVDLQHPIPE